MLYAITSLTRAVGRKVTSPLYNISQNITISNWSAIIRAFIKMKKVKYPLPAELLQIKNVENFTVWIY